jgi:DNA-directed RNA polymerase subunit delta
LLKHNLKNPKQKQAVRGVLHLCAKYSILRANFSIFSQVSMMNKSTNTNKKRIVKDYENLPQEVVSRVKLEYPYGFAEHLIFFTNKEGKKVSALPFETDDVYYLIRMTAKEAKQIVDEDEDYDEEGNLRDDFSFDYGNDEEEEDEGKRDIADDHDPYQEI